ncbi:MBL fold metallo-hydrolase [Streptomyces sp. HPF1205]|uniref:MBL fold metallo-hydrolase n=1 Tax=Streptomyces sp. HPF1205 TaxID=2873262 RepID=UPI001CED8FEC|nr:MBL fold metallo-hydrolase [Streptomyces sp. HPF1205]
MNFPLPRDLRALTPRVHAWLPDGHATWGMANCVLVAGRGTALLVDTPYTAGMTGRLLELAAGVLAPGTGIDTVVNTHGNGDHSYGNALFPKARIIATEANARHLCAEPAPADLARLVAASDASTPLGAYVRRHFGRYGDFGGLSMVPPNETFSGELVLDVGGVAVRLIEVGPAHTEGDLIVHLPDEGIVCAGDVLFSEDHPVHWAGPIDEIHRATMRVLECDPRVVVAGHGPLMSPADVRAYAEYLLELREAIHSAHRAGRPLAQLSAELVGGDTRPHWGLTERMAILASLEYRALDHDDTPPDLIGLVGFAAGFAAVPADEDDGGHDGKDADGAETAGAVAESAIAGPLVRNAAVPDAVPPVA